MKIVKLLVLATVVFAWGTSAMADAPDKGFDHTHGIWDAWLKKHVTVKGGASTVNYKAAKKEPGNFPQYIKSLSNVTKENYKGFDKNQQLAFLINAYNAFTVKLILDNYPLKSIKDTGSLFTSPWKKKFFTFLGEKQHLDGIEHGMIRKDFSEPRIHMAVVCASIGCPMLRNEAWTSEKLEAQLEDSAKSFLSDSSRNRFNEKEKKFELSKIFDWYGGDFEKAEGSVTKFVAKYMAKNDAQKDVMLNADVDFLDYDWNLNETK